MAELYIPVLVVSGYLTNDCIVQLLARARLVHVAPKPFGARALAQTIHNVVRRANPARELAKKFGFTLAEADVIEAAASGATNADLVERLEMSRGTIRTHWAHIFDKMERHGLPRTREAATGLFVRFLRGED